MSTKNRIQEMTSSVLQTPALLYSFSFSLSSYLKVHRFRNRARQLPDGDLVVFVDAQDDRVDIVVLLQRPQQQPPQVLGVDELAKRLARTKDRERRVVLLGQVDLVDESWGDVAVLEVEVVILAEHVGKDDRRVVNSIVLVVHPRKDINHTLGVCIALVGRVRGAVVEHGFVDRVGRLVRENACRKARHKLLDATFVAFLHDIVLHCQIEAEKVDLLFLEGHFLLIFIFIAGRDNVSAWNSF